MCYIRLDLSIIFILNFWDSFMIHDEILAVLWLKNDLIDTEELKGNAMNKIKVATDMTLELDLCTILPFPEKKASHANDMQNVKLEIFKYSPTKH